MSSFDSHLLSDEYRSFVYSGIDDSEGDVNIKGWENKGFEPFMQYVIGKTRPSIVVELGSWHGRSTNKVASILKQSQQDRKSDAKVKVIAVDTWLGSPEHYTVMIKESLPALARVNGYPTMYRKFLSNAVLHKNDDAIVPLPLPSLHAAEVLRYHGISPELVYVDAAHDDASVYADVSAFWSILKPGCYMIGDDWEMEGVRSAVDRFCLEKKLTLHVGGGVWCARKPA